MAQAQKQHQQQQTVAPGAQLASMPQAHLGPITNTQTSMNWFSGEVTNIASPSHHVYMIHDQYPTPPSHHSSHIGTDGTPQHMTGYAPDHPYLTPSPDSPGQWSSSSPHSAQSDWSENISSPPTQPVGNLSLSNKTSAKRDNASVYI